jgi:predicted O-methyltransferase YrrM
MALPDSSARPAVQCFATEGEAMPTGGKRDVAQSIVRALAKRSRLQVLLSNWRRTAAESRARRDVELIERACAEWNADAYKNTFNNLRRAAQRLWPALTQCPFLSSHLQRRIAKIDTAIRCLSRQPQVFPEIFHGVAVSDDGTFALLDASEASHVSAHGLLGAEDIHALQEISTRLSRGTLTPLRIAELGSAAGCGSTRIFGALVKSCGGKLFCIDPWPGRMYRIFLANLKIFDLEDAVMPIRGMSVETAAQFEDGSLDGVFLDGSHIYEDVLADIDAYLPKIRKGGILFGHDLYDLPSRFDRQELLGIAGLNNAMAAYRNEYADVERVDVHPGVILAVQDRFGDEIEHFAKSAVWATQI